MKQNHGWGVGGGGANSRKAANENPVLSIYTHDQLSFCIEHPYGFFTFMPTKDMYCL